MLEGVGRLMLVELATLEAILTDPDGNEIVDEATMLIVDGLMPPTSLLLTGQMPGAVAVTVTVTTEEGLTIVAGLLAVADTGLFTDDVAAERSLTGVELTPYQVPP